MGSLVSQVSSWLGSTLQSWMMELYTGAVQHFQEGGMKPICLFQVLAIPSAHTLIQYAETAGGRCINHVQLPSKLSFSETSGTGSVKTAGQYMRTGLQSPQSYCLLPVLVIGMTLFWGLHKLVCAEWVGFKSHLLSFHMSRNFSQDFHDLNLLITNSYILFWFNGPFWSLWIFSVLSSDAFILLRMLCLPCNFS